MNQNANRIPGKIGAGHRVNHGGVDQGSQDQCEDEVSNSENHRGGWEIASGLDAVMHQTQDRHERDDRDRHDAKQQAKVIPQQADRLIENPAQPKLLDLVLHADCL